MKYELFPIIEKVEENLEDFLFSADLGYQRNLVATYGKTPEEAKRLTCWDWTHGVGLFGLYKRYQFTQDERKLDVIERWFDNRLMIGLPEKNVNTVAPLLTMAHLHKIRPNQKYREVMDEWAEWIMWDMPRTEEGGILHSHAELNNKQELWDDTLFMTVLFLAQYGMLFRRADCVSEAAYQYLIHVKYLQDPVSGLWYHGWRFERRDHFAGAFWGRGNSWVTIFCCEYLEVMNLQNEMKKFTQQLLNNQVDALETYQDQSGMWHTLIDDPTSYLEASGTAGFCYGILAGIRKGYLDKKYSSCAEQALQAIVNHITPAGELLNVSYGTNVGTSLEDYKKIKQQKMHYGQSLALLALTEGLYMK